MHNESGYLLLPWTPFYGFGVVICILVFIFVSKRIHDNLKRKIVLFVLLFILLSCLELIGGILLNSLFGYSLWTYEMVPLHIGKYISIPTSFLWVTFSLFYLFIIKKYSDIVVNRIPHIITYSLLFLFIIDNIVTIAKLLSYKI